MTGPDPTRPRWEQAPGPPAPPARPAVPWRLPAAVVLAGAGPVVRTLAIAPAPRPLVVAIVAVVAVVLVDVQPRRAWARSGAVAVVAAGLAMPAGGRTVGLWLGAGVVLATWALRDHRPHPRLGPVPSDALPGLAALALVALQLGRSATATLAPLVLVAAALAGAAVSSAHPSWPGRLSAGIRDVVGRVAPAVLLAPVGLAVLVVPWLLHRALGVDPLRAPVGPDGTVRVARHRHHPERMWTDRVALDPLSRGARARRRAVTPLGVLVAVVLLVVAVGQPWRDRTPDVPEAFADSPWWPEHRAMLDWYITEGVNSLLTDRQRDVTSGTVNVEDGMRRGWRPPDCAECPEVELWVYGGSTTFGVGQRDEHTIASELARLAWADGIALTVDNRGIVGATHWVEANRFGWDLADGDQPDVVTFYDGANEMAAAWLDGSRGPGSAPDFSAEVMRRSLEPYQRIYRAIDGVPRPDDAHFTDPPAQGLSGAAQGRLAVERYERSRRTSVALADAAGVPGVWFWQPTRRSHDREQPEPPPGTVDTSWDAVVAARAGLVGEDVVDLTDAYDDEPSALFFDEVHTNELGARLAAEAMYESLRGPLLAAAGKPGP